MGEVRKFEDLIAWQKARSLTRAIYMTSREGNFAKDFGLSGQIQRAAVSIMANIAEGYERNSSKEFHKFLCIAKASCAELRSHLYIAYDIGYFPESKFKELNAQAQEVARIIGGLKVSIRRKIQSSQ